MAHHIYLVRHGKTQYNLENRMQGFSDSPLLEEAKQQAYDLGQYLKAQNLIFDKFYASPLKRVKDSMHYFLTGYDKEEADVIYLDNLKEYYFGEAESLTVKEVYTEIARHLNMPSATAFEKYTLLERCDMIRKLPQYASGEKQSDFLVRIRCAMSEIRDDNRDKDDKNILVFAHGIVIHGLLTLCQNGHEAPLYVDNLALTKLRLNADDMVMEFASKKVI